MTGAGSPQFTVELLLLYPIKLVYPSLGFAAEAVALTEALPFLSVVGGVTGAGEGEEEVALGAAFPPVEGLLAVIAEEGVGVGVGVVFPDLVSTATTGTLVLTVTPAPSLAFAMSVIPSYNP